MRKRQPSPVVGRHASRRCRAVASGGSVRIASRIFREGSSSMVGMNARIGAVAQLVQELGAIPPSTALDTDTDSMVRLTEPDDVTVFSPLDRAE
jgi:hypothetical protein